VNTPELKAVLDFLEPARLTGMADPAVPPTTSMASKNTTTLLEESNNKCFALRFPESDSVRELLGQKMDALAWKFHETHDMKVKHN